MPIAKPHLRLTHSFLQEVLNYNPDTGIWTWCISRQGGVKSGDIAGCLLKKSNRRIIRLLGRNLYSSVLVWFYMTGEWPSYDLDQINRDKSDD